MNSRKRPRRITLETEGIVNPGQRDICVYCWYTLADLKTSVGKFHEECLEAHMHEFHAPPERLVRKNRSKE